MKKSNYVRIALGASIALTMTACKSEVAPDAEETEMVEAVAEKAPVETPVSKYVTDTEALFTFLTEGGYKEYPAMDERHPSIGPHDEVRVFWNQTIADSFAAGNTEHPAGSMIVKEQYKPGEDELYGWSVSIKTHEEGDNGKGWYWIEFLDSKDSSNIFPAEPGNGVPDCAACHTLGQDLVRSTFPQS